MLLHASLQLDGSDTFRFPFHPSRKDDVYDGKEYIASPTAGKLPLFEDCNDASEEHRVFDRAGVNEP